MIGSYLVDN